MTDQTENTEITADETDKNRTAVIGETELKGSDDHPDVFHLKDGSKKTLADVIIHTYMTLKRTMQHLTPQLWNELPDDEREDHIGAIVGTIETTEGNQPMPIESQPLPETENTPTPDTEGNDQTGSTQTGTESNTNNTSTLASESSSPEVPAESSTEELTVTEGNDQSDALSSDTPEEIPAEDSEGVPEIAEEITEEEADKADAPEENGDEGEDDKTSE